MTRLIARLLKALVFASLYNSATKSDVPLLDENNEKHVKVLLQCLIVVPGAYLAVRFGGDTAQQIVFFVSIAAQVAGLAWFVISFAALPMRHGDGAMKITASMFSSFVAGMYSLTVLCSMTAPWALGVIIPIFLWLYKAAALYDSADLLKMGKDEEELLAAKSTQRIEQILIALCTKLRVELPTDDKSAN